MRRRVASAEVWSLVITTVTLMVGVLVLVWTDGDSPEAIFWSVIAVVVIGGALYILHRSRRARERERRAADAARVFK